MQTLSVTQYRLPESLSFPDSITSGPDGNLWLVWHVSTSPTSYKIGKITTTGALTEYDATPYAARFITAGPYGNLWFTGSNLLGKITTAGGVTTYGTPSCSQSGSIAGITTGSDAALWFTVGANCNQIDRSTTTGAMTSYAAGSAQNPGVIVNGPDGNLWLAATNAIAKLTTSGVITVFGQPAMSQPLGLAVGSDGNVWFSDADNAMGRITTGGIVTEYPLPPSYHAFPTVVAKARDGNVWFAESHTGLLGKITPAGIVTEYNLPIQMLPNGAPAAMTSGPDGNLWLVSNDGVYGYVDKVSLP